jgi:O-antigen ligase
MSVFVFAIPFPFTTAISEICFYGSVGIFILLIFLKKPRPSFDTPLTFPFCLLVFWAVCGIFFALNKENTTHDIVYHLLKQLAVFYLLITFFCTIKRFHCLTWIILVSSTLFSIGSIVYYYVILGNDITTRLSLPQIDVGTNYFGYISVLAIIISLTYAGRASLLYRKMMMLVPLFGAVITCLLTSTRGTILGAIAPLILLVPKYKMLSAVSIIMIAFIVLLIPAKDILTPQKLIAKIEGDDRTLIWAAYGKAIQEFPITGIGFGMQIYDENLYRKYNLQLPTAHRPLKDFQGPHNIFVDIAVRLGLVGFLIFIYLTFNFMKTGWRLITRGRDDSIRSWALGVMVIFVSYLIQGLFSDLFLSAQAIWFFIVLALMTILHRLNENQDNGIVTV